MAFVRRLRDSLIPGAAFPESVVVATGGVPAQGADFLDRLYDWFPLLVAAVLAVTAVVLLRAFRSVVLPVKAVVLNLLSVAAACGVVVAVVQWGIGADLLGVAESSAIEGWIPVFAFALLFGLSMDYEVFLVMPMREAIDAGETCDGAVTAGLVRTGRVVTAAAVIMVAVFSGFVLGDVPGLQQLGIVPRGRRSRRRDGRPTRARARDRRDPRAVELVAPRAAVRPRSPVRGVRRYEAGRASVRPRVVSSSDDGDGEPERGQVVACAEPRGVHREPE